MFSSLLRFRSVGRAFLVIGTLAALPATRPLADDKPAFFSPAEQRMRADVTYLASDLREGRGAGTQGLDAAADYIAAVFREVGLKPPPGGDGYFQPFSIPGEARPIDPTSLVIHAPGGTNLNGQLRVDFTPLQCGGGGAPKDVPIVFAGYGITAHDKDLDIDYDDYDGVDVKGKAVLILRAEPKWKAKDGEGSRPGPTTFAQFRHKGRNAASHGIAAVLMVNNETNLKAGQDELLDYTYAAGDGTGVPFIMLTRGFADRLLKAVGAPSIAELEAKIQGDLKPHSLPLEGATLSAEVTVEKKPFPMKNVIGVLEGSGPLAEETVVIGAHYDHVGYGGQGSLAMGVRAIHNGADDNASGTALIMELARRMARRSEPLPRRLVFMAYSGEERGLLGSRHYVDHPLIPLKSTVAMLNFDMVGRLVPDHGLTIFGAPSIPGLEALVVPLAKSQGIEAKIVKDTSNEFNASDHASFYRKDVPVFFAYTGAHPDYHRPSDDTEKINFDGMTRIANFAELILLDIARRPERPVFAKIPGPARGISVARSGSSAGNGAYLGTRPAYDEDGKKGVKLDGVSENSPAEKAGLKEGDRIVKIGADAIENVTDLFEVLGKHKPGQTLDVVILRDDKETTLKATLGTRAGGN